MTKCNSCGIYIIDNNETCPLCHTISSNTGETKDVINPYPDIRQGRRRFSLFLRIMLFLCVTVTLICMFVNFRLRAFTPWSVIVGISLFYSYFMFRLLSNTYAGYQKKIFLGIFWAVVGLVTIDFAYGFYRWSFNYVMPGALLFLNIVLIVLMIINRRNWQSYMMHQFIFILIALLPLVFINVGLVTSPFLSELSFISCIVVFLGTLIIGGRTANIELKRRFHI